MLGVSVTPTLPDDGLKIAVITSAGVVVAAVITGLAGIRGRAHRPETSTSVAQQFIDEQLQVADTNAARIEQLERQLAAGTRRLDELERMLWRAGVDPKNGQPVRHQQHQAAREPDQAD